MNLLNLFAYFISLTDRIRSDGSSFYKPPTAKLLASLSFITAHTSVYGYRLLVEGLINYWFIIVNRSW